MRSVPPDVPAAPPSPAAHARQRWVVAFAAALMNALQSGAFFFTPTTLMPKIVSDFDLDLSLSTVPIAVGKVAYVLLLIPGGILVDRYGPRRGVLLGVAGLTALMTLYAAFVTSFWQLLVAHICLASFASVSGVPVYSIFIAQWFEGGIGLAMGLVLAGYSAAGTAVPALLGPVATVFGWRVAMGCMCGLLCFVALPLTYFFLQENVDDDDKEEDDDDILTLEEHVMLSAPARLEERMPLIPEDGPIPVLSNRGMADSKSWTFVGFAFSYILLQYCFGCFGENIMFFLTIDRDMSLAVASLFFSALNLSAFTAKLVGGHLGDRFDRFHVASAASGLAAVGIVFLFLGTSGFDDHHLPRLTPHPLAVLMFTVLFGFGYGATFNCLYALTPIVFGKQNLGRTQSALFGLGLAGNAVGSVLTGVLRSNYNTYQRPFLIAAVACMSNFFVFNVTRMTLGGSVEGMKELNAEQDAFVTSGTFQSIDELDRLGEPARLHATHAMDIGISPGASPRMSGPSSFPNVLGVGGAMGGISRSSSRHSGTGMQAEEGFPIARDWSSSSLRAYLRRSPSDSGRASPRPIRLKKSSTMEAMIQSGILSASLEAAGYLGRSPGPMSSFSLAARAGSPATGAVDVEVPAIWPAATGADGSGCGNGGGGG